MVVVITHLSNLSEMDALQSVINAYNGPDGTYGIYIKDDGPELGVLKKEGGTYIVTDSNYNKESDA